MIIANFTCPKCRAVLDLENVEEGQLIDCPQCGAPFEIPRRKAEKKVVIIPPLPPKPVKPPKPPYPGWSVAANFFAGICLMFTFGLIMAEHFDAAVQGIASAIAFALVAFLIKVLCDIRWHLERIAK